MTRTIVPVSVIGGVATNHTATKELPLKTDVEAVQHWEDEGGAFSHSDDSATVTDASQIREIEGSKGAMCV